jgi:hypothetical protein
MKMIVRTLGLGAVIAAFMAVGGVTAFAQDPCADLDAINALDTKIRADYPKMETKPQAIDEGKQYLEKYGSCPVSADFAGWLKGRIPAWENDVKTAKQAEIVGAATKRFDTAVSGKNWDDAFAAGSDYAAKFPDDPTLIHKYIPLALIGYSESYSSKNYKFNANSEKYAKISLDLLKSGNAKPKSNGHFGAFQFECANKDECVSLLTFAMGYMTFKGDGNKQAGLPYLYEVTKLPGTFKSNAEVYGMIGDYYYETVRKLADEVKAQIADQKDTDPDDVKAKKEADIKAKIALLNGYTERAMDAYSRAYTFAKANPEGKAYSDNVYKTVQSLYNVRFAKTEGVDTWISSAVAKPFPDPTSAVAPIADAETTTGGGSTGSTPPVKPAATPAATPSKPSSTTGPAKPGNKVGGTGSTGISENAAAENAKAPAAKSATIKRTGNR